MRFSMYLYLWRVDGDFDEYSNTVGKDEVVESIYERLRFPRGVELFVALTSYFSVRAPRIQLILIAQIRVAPL